MFRNKSCHLYSNFNWIVFHNLYYMYVICAYFNQVFANFISFGIFGCIFKNIEYYFVSMLYWLKSNSRPSPYFTQPSNWNDSQRTSRNLVIYIGYYFDIYIKGAQNCQMHSLLCDIYSFGYSQSVCVFLPEYADT